MSVKIINCVLKITSLLVTVTLLIHGEGCTERLPHLELTHKIINGSNIREATCALPCAPKFDPQITIIPCKTGQECDNLKVCLDQEYREENKGTCWKELYTGSPTLKYEKLSGLIKCRDKNNLTLSTTDLILEPNFIPGRGSEREGLLQGGSRSELIFIDHYSGSTPYVIYTNGTRGLYPEGEETIYAKPSRFFFQDKCEWILRQQDGTLLELENKGGTAYSQESIKFKVPRQSGAVICSVKWYNSTEKLQKEFPFIVIEPLKATMEPKIDKTRKTENFLGFNKKHLIKCPFIGGDGQVTWSSSNNTIDKDSPESYRNVGGNIIESVIEVKYFERDHPMGFINQDQLTCLVTNQFGNDSHTITISPHKETSAAGRRTKIKYFIIFPLLFLIPLL